MPMRIGRQALNAAGDVLSFTLVKPGGSTAWETIRNRDKQALAAVIPFPLASDFQGKAGRSLDG
jgi:hypothetical protein